MPAFEFEYLPQDEQALSDLQAAPLPILIPDYFAHQCYLPGPESST